MYIGALMENVINRQFAYNEKYYQPAHMSVSRWRVLFNSVLLFGRQGLDEAPLSEPACFLLLSLIVSCAYSLVCGMLIKLFLLLLIVLKRRLLAAQRLSDIDSMLIQRREVILTSRR